MNKEGLSLDDFEIGDEVWCVEIADFTHRSQEAEISITAMRGKLNVVQDRWHLEPRKVAMDECELVISDKNFINCRSKNEAIDAMINGLEEMKDE